MDLTRISFGKDMYHKQREMILWCENNLGQGGYYAFTKDPENAKWSVDSMFGNTHFFFKDSKDAMLFTLLWR